MPPLPPHQLTEKKILRLKDGFHADGGNLYLYVRGISRAWIFRFKSPMTDKIRQMSLGTMPDVRLSQARDMAFACRKMLKDNLDPLQQKRSGHLKTQQKKILFEQVAKNYINDKSRQWKGRNTRREMESLLTLYAYPFFKDRDITSITSDDMLTLLKPLWKEKTVTGSKLQGLIDRVLKYAIARGWFYGESPARWRGFLENLLPKPSIITKIKHRKAYDWQNINKLYQELSINHDIASLTARFICLTACRSNEAREMRIEEINFDNAVWTLPATRSKTDQERRIPLSDDAMELLKQAIQGRDRGLVFLSDQKLVSGKAILEAVKLAAKDKEITVHGLRSSFRDWASEATSFPTELAEMTLGHSVQSKVEAAYRRGDMLDKRRKLINQWNKHCTR